MSPASNNYDLARARMVREQLIPRGITDQRVLDAMGTVQRDIFVQDALHGQAYGDFPLPIGEGQTISAPHMVAMMCDYLDLRKGDKVLEVGAGSGYHAAVIAEIIGEEGHVYTIERIEWLVNFSTSNLKRAGYKNVTVSLGDGTLGLPEHAPYDKIDVTCAAPDVPPPYTARHRS